jgi:hypothetical protein
MVTAAWATDARAAGAARAVTVMLEVSSVATSTAAAANRCLRMAAMVILDMSGFLLRFGPT